MNGRDSLFPFRDKREVCDFALRGDVRAMRIRTRHHARDRCMCPHCKRLRRPWTWRLRVLP